MISKNLRIRLLFVLATVLVCLAMLEVGLRVAGRPPSNMTEGLFEQHGTAYRLRKNLTKVSRTPSFTTTVHTNSFGLRDKVPGPRKLGMAPYVAWVGDSLTFGNGVDYEQSFVGVFGTFAERQHIEVINLAVGGYHLSESEGLLGEFLDSAPTPPSTVVFVFSPQGISTFEERYSDVFVKDGYIFQKDRWFVPYVVVSLGNGSAAYCFFRDALRRVQARLVPSSGAASVQPLKLYSTRGPWAATDLPARFEAKLTGIEQRVRRAGAKLVYVYMPTSVDLHSPELLASEGLPASDYDFNLYRDLLRRHSARTSTRFVDLSAMLQAEYGKGKPLSFLQDPHYNAETNRLIGKALYSALLDNGEHASAVPR
jgi:hypothetical protein